MLDSARQNDRRRATIQVRWLKKDARKEKEWNINGRFLLLLLLLSSPFSCASMDVESLSFRASALDRHSAPSAPSTVCMYMPSNIVQNISNGTLKCACMRMKQQLQRHRRPYISEQIGFGAEHIHRQTEKRKPKKCLAHCMRLSVSQTFSLVLLSVLVSMVSVQKNSSPFPTPAPISKGKKSLLLWKNSMHSH